MCANYVPVTQADDLLKYFGVDRDMTQLPPEAYPTTIAPFIRLTADGTRAIDGGHFGLLPAWRREVRYGTNTYNARSETVHSKPSFADSWKRGLRCVVPAWAAYEPLYSDDHTSERWRIEREDKQPFGIAGVYSQWFEGGVEKFSFSMLTVNCDDHPFYKQFHQPGKEKRMPVFLEPHEYDRWMSCSVEEAKSFFRQAHGPFVGKPEPRKPRPKPTEPKEAKEAKPVKPPKPPKPSPTPKPPAPQGSLF